MMLIEMIANRLSTGKGLEDLEDELPDRYGIKDCHVEESVSSPKRVIIVTTYEFLDGDKDRTTKLIVIATPTLTSNRVHVDVIGKVEDFWSDNVVDGIKNLFQVSLTKEV